MEGSGRLCDYLPLAYLTKSTAAYDAYRAARDVITKCGFDSKPDPADGVAVSSILSGDLAVHQLRNGSTALKRLLQSCFTGSDGALQEAIQRHKQYVSTADSLDRPDKCLLSVYLAISVVLTTLVTVSAEFLQTQDCDDEACRICTPTSGQGCNLLDYAIVALPVVLSVIVNLRANLKYEHAVKTLRYSAAQVDSAMWEYVTRAGVYADMSALMEERVDGPVLDTHSARAQKLSQRLVEISELLGDSIPSLKSGDGFLDRCCMPRQGMRFGRSSAASPTQRFPRAVFSTEARGNKYVTYRLREQYSKWCAVDVRAHRQHVLFEALSYVFGAVGTMLALLGRQTWVAVTTALVTTLATWNSRSPVEQRMRRARSAVRVLRNVMAEWDAVPDEIRGKQEVIDRLVLRGEAAILAAEEMPPPVEVRTRAENQVPLSG
jgi:hypothetical protein